MQVLLKHRKDVKLDDLEATKDFLAVFYRANSLQVIHWLELSWSHGYTPCDAVASLPAT